MSAQPYQIIAINELGSPYRYVMRGGQNVGIEMGQLFYVHIRDMEIRDPDTQELLDTFTIIKLPLKVVEVRERVSMCDHAMPKLPDGWRGGSERIEVGDTVKPLPSIETGMEEAAPFWKRLFGS